MEFNLQSDGILLAEQHRGQGLKNLYGTSGEDKAAGANKLREKWQTARGQLWEFPSVSTAGVIHRLMIGDSSYLICHNFLAT